MLLRPLHLHLAMSLCIGSMPPTLWKDKSFRVSKMSGAKPKSTQRYRICGTPSRLGCVTCKIRRVKCGEEKPFCKRCTSTGRKCDGYGPPPPPKSPRANSLNTQKGRSLSRSPSASISRLSLIPLQDPLEKELLDFFTSTTVKSLSANFWPGFWQDRVLQTSTVEPSVLHAIIAIAAVHRDLDLKSKGQYDGNLQPFAFKQYTTAISHLHRLMSSGTQHLDVTLISCILFICFDFLVANHASAIIHLNAGLKILEDLPNPDKKSVHKWKQEFAPILLTLGVQAAAFANSQYPAERSALWASLTTLTLPNQSSPLTSLENARHALDTIAAEMMASRETLYSTSNAQHLTSLQFWIQNLDMYLSSIASNDTNTARGAAILKIYYLLVSSIVNPLQPPHEELLALAEHIILTNPSQAHKFTITHDLVFPLFITALATPDPYVQSRAVDLLKLAPGREGAWPQGEALRILQQLVRVEEMPILRVGPMIRTGVGSSTGNHQTTTDGSSWETDKMRNQRVWREVQSALQSGLEWVGEESPIQEGEIEVGRFEGSSMDLEFSDMDFLGVGGSSSHSNSLGFPSSSSASGGGARLGSSSSSMGGMLDAAGGYPDWNAG